MSEAQVTNSVEAMREKLAALREARAKREAATEVDTLAEQIEREERAAATAEAIATTEAKHGKLGVHIAAVGTRLGVVIVKRPHVATYRKFQELADPKANDLENFVRPCVVYPDAAAFDRINDELPGVMGVAAKLIGRLAGAASEELMGKS